MSDSKSIRDVGMDYISENQALGLKFQKNAQMMNRFVKLAESTGHHAPILEKSLVDLWCEKTEHETESNRQHRASFIRGFANYLIRLGYPAYVYNTKGSVERQTYQPHIYSNLELSRLFDSAESLKCSGKYPFRGSQTSLILKTLYSTGMRSSELTHLRKKDIDLNNGLVFVSHSKFSKERYIPINKNLNEQLCSFSKHMQHYVQWNKSDFFFINSHGTFIKDIYHPFREALMLAGISHGGRGVGPRVHDIRHTFAVHCLRKWVRESKDLTTALPYLSAYMGHVGIRSSQYYLRLTAELYPDIIEKLDINYGWIIPEVDAYEAN